MEKDLPYDLLEPYLQGKLDETERSAFEQRLKTDAELQQQLALYQKIREANQDKDLSAFEKKLQAAQTAHFKRPDRSLKSIRRRILIWVPAAVLVLSFVYFFGKKYLDAGPGDPAEIYAQYAQHDFSFQEMSNGNELAEMENLLNAGQFAEVLPKLDEFLKNQPDRADVQLAKGIALMETGKAAQAIEIFTELGAQYSLYLAESQWYTALAYLKQGQLDESLSYLQQIPKNASRYAEAQGLIRALRKAVE